MINIIYVQYCRDIFRRLPQKYEGRVRSPFLFLSVYFREEALTYTQLCVVLTLKVIYMYNFYCLMFWDWNTLIEPPFSGSLLVPRPKNWIQMTGPVEPRRTLANEPYAGTAASSITESTDNDAMHAAAAIIAIDAAASIDAVVSYYQPQRSNFHNQDEGVNTNDPSLWFMEKFPLFSIWSPRLIHSCCHSHHSGPHLDLSIKHRGQLQQWLHSVEYLQYVALISFLDQADPSFSSLLLLLVRLYIINSWVVDFAVHPMATHLGGVFVDVFRCPS